MTVVRVDGLNGTAGVKIIVSPADCQLPGTFGVTLGSGEAVPEAGVTDRIRNGGLPMLAPVPKWFVVPGRATE